MKSKSLFFLGGGGGDLFVQLFLEFTIVVDSRLIESATSLKHLKSLSSSFFGWLVGRSACHNFLQKRGTIGALFYFNVSPVFICM